MKLLIAIMSCWAHERNGDNDAVRATWLRHLPIEIDYKFFLGSGTSTSDIEALPVLDDRANLVYKSQKIHQFGLEREYDFVFKTDRDVYVNVARLLQSDFYRADYSGFLHTAAGAQTDFGLCAHGFLGGSGYWTSRHACQIISAACPTVGQGEDFWTGHVLGASGIQPVSLPGYGTEITIHAPHPFEQYDKTWMFDIHDRNKA